MIWSKRKQVSIIFPFKFQNKKLNLFQIFLNFQQQKKVEIITNFKWQPIRFDITFVVTEYYIQRKEKQEYYW